MFLCIWAIVIALNEVLFAAQPFALTGLAAAMPHTLLFTVVLSSAIYLAKNKIIEAIESGKPIDKKFVSELTPQVAKEVSAMRRKVEKSKGQVKRSKDGRKIKQDPRVFPSQSEIASAKAKNNLKIDEQIAKNLSEEAKANRVKNIEDLALEKEQSQKKSPLEKAKEALTKQLAPKGQERKEATNNSKAKAPAKTKAQLNKEDLALFDKLQTKVEVKDHHESKEVAPQKEDVFVVGEVKEKAPAPMTAQEKIAQAKKMQQLSEQRRKEKIEALAQITKEHANANNKQDKQALINAAIARQKALQRKQALQAQKEQEVQQEQVATKQEQKVATQAKANNNQAKPVVKAQAKAMANNQAKVSTNQLAHGTTDTISRERNVSKVIEDHVNSAQNQIQEQMAASTSNLQHTPKFKVNSQNISPNIIQSKVNNAKAENKVRIQNTQIASSMQRVEQAAAKKVVTQSLINNPQSKLDTSALQKRVIPKSGAGLDLSALKKVKLNNMNRQHVESIQFGTSGAAMIKTSAMHQSMGTLKLKSNASNAEMIKPTIKPVVNNNQQLTKVAHERIGQMKSQHLENNVSVKNVAESLGINTYELNRAFSNISRNTRNNLVQRASQEATVQNIGANTKNFAEVSQRLNANVKRMNGAQIKPNVPNNTMVNNTMRKVSTINASDSAINHDNLNTANF